MNQTKKLLVVVAIFATGAIHAQTDLKLNILNALFYEVAAEAEFGLNDNVSLTGFGGYVYGFPGVSEYTKYGYIGPEVRFYVSPDQGIDRFYIGMYMRYKDGYCSANAYESGYMMDGQYVSRNWNYDLDYNKLAAGFTIGAKWVTWSGFVFGFKGCLGRNLFANYDDVNLGFSDPSDFQQGTYSNGFYRADIDSQYWDFRIAFNVGWRIGK